MLPLAIGGCSSVAKRRGTPLPHSLHGFRAWPWRAALARAPSIIATWRCRSSALMVSRFASRNRFCGLRRRSSVTPFTHGAAGSLAVHAVAESGTAAASAATSPKVAATRASSASGRSAQPGRVDHAGRRRAGGTASAPWWCGLAIALAHRAGVLARRAEQRIGQRRLARARGPSSASVRPGSVCCARGRRSPRHHASSATISTPAGNRSRSVCMRANSARASTNGVGLAQHDHRRTPPLPLHEREEALHAARVEVGPGPSRAARCRRWPPPGGGAVGIAAHRGGSGGTPRTQSFAVHVGRGQHQSPTASASSSSASARARRALHARDVPVRLRAAARSRLRSTVGRIAASGAAHNRGCAAQAIAWFAERGVRSHRARRRSKSSCIMVTIDPIGSQAGWNDHAGRPRASGARSLTKAAAGCAAQVTRGDRRRGLGRETRGASGANRERARSVVFIHRAPPRFRVRGSREGRRRRVSVSKAARRVDNGAGAGGCVRSAPSFAHARPP